MEQAFVERLEKSFNLLAPRGPELVDRFYAHLFSKDPELRPMFPTDMKEQRKKLLASIVLVMQNIRQPDKLQEPLTEMGRRHVGYGTKPEHYPVVRDTLVQVMSEMAGDQWSDQLTDDWTTALNVVAGIMIEGHRLEEKARAHAASKP